MKSGGVADRHEGRAGPRCNWTHRRGRARGRLSRRTGHLVRSAGHAGTPGTCDCPGRTRPPQRACDTSPMFELFGMARKTQVPSARESLPGRPERPYAIASRHVVLGAPLEGPWPAGSESIYLAMGCFWGAEKLYWQVPGVVVTAVGYMGGHTPNPTYEESCTGRTGHAETVLVVHDPAVVSTRQLLAVFWENHDPTQGMRQGNDVGSCYRSAIYWTSDEQREAVEESPVAFQKALSGKDLGEITTEIRAAAEAGPFY